MKVFERLRWIGVCSAICVIAGCSGGGDDGAATTTVPARSAPSELEKDTSLSQPPKISPPP